MAIEQNLGYFFFDKDILKQALTTSACAAQQEFTASQSSYQVLGNHLIQMVVVELLIRYGYSDAAEIQYWLGQLINAETLSEMARSLQIDRCLRLSPDEQADSAQPDAALLAATLEATIGGIYFDGGFRSAAEAVKRLFQAAFT